MEVTFRPLATSATATPTGLVIVLESLAFRSRRTSTRRSCSFLVVSESLLGVAWLAASEIEGEEELIPET